jgi:hypothetical protein
MELKATAPPTADDSSVISADNVRDRLALGIGERDQQLIAADRIAPPRSVFVGEGRVVRPDDRQGADRTCQVARATMPQH